jgi:hypothetical protein
MDSHWLNSDENRTGNIVISANTPRSSEQSETQSGYVIAMTALLLVPMIVLAAFAVDVGSWYADSARIQRAADAAALAAVVYMPSEQVAHAKAIEIAAQNGFISDIDENGAAVAAGNSTLTFVGDGATVNIRIDYKGELFFAKAFLSDVDLARTSSAEFIEPVRMANPTSGLGMGNLTNGDGFWLSINHYCLPMEHGDPFVRYYRRPPGSGSAWNECDNTNHYANPLGELSPAAGGAGFDGYVFVVDIPEDATTSSQLQIYDPGWCSATDFSNLEEPDIEAFVYAPDNTLNISSDNLASTPVAHVTWDADNQDSGQCGWHNVFTMPAPPNERQLWYVKMRAVNENDGYALNQFSLRVVPGSTGDLCSSDSASSLPVVVGCPNVYALEWLPIYRPNFGGASTAEFFLANVPDYHEGKTLEVTLFDPGEGMREIEILHPNGDTADFDYWTVDNDVFELTGNGLGDSGPFNAESGVSSSLGDSNGCLPPGTSSTSYCVRVDTGTSFNGRALQLKIDLTGHSCAGPITAQNCWFKVRYVAGTDVHDRTTWKVRIIGDPIRLTE